MKKQRLDDILFANGLISKKDEAFVIVTEGRVLVDGQKAVTPAQLVLPDAKIEVRKEREYVGRGAYKLVGALDAFGVDPQGKICADLGSATGGFTEVLLKRGAKKVYAIDTARGKLAARLRNNDKVVVMERVDARDVSLPESVDIVTIDISLVSLRQIVTSARNFFKKDGILVALFKPQYETRDPTHLAHGIVKNAEFRESLVQDFIVWAEENGWKVERYIESPIQGSKGNVEYLLKLKLQVSSTK